jgi:hypothetical protein
VTAQINTLLGQETDAEQVVAIRAVPAPAVPALAMVLPATLAHQLTVLIFLLAAALAAVHLGAHSSALPFIKRAWKTAERNV